VKRKNVVKFCRKKRESQGYEEARKQEESTDELHREDEHREMRRADGTNELERERIRRRSLVNEIQEPVQAEDRKHQSQQVARDDRNSLHDNSPIRWPARAPARPRGAG
jgi:hypothetical protein